MIPVIPCPVTYQKSNEQIQFANFRIVIAKSYETAVALFLTELDRKLQCDEQKECYTFEFELNKSMDKEAYVIQMEKKITYVEGGSERALFNATRTLSQLLYLNTRGKVTRLETAAYQIKDHCYKKNRSFLIDESEYFLGPESIKKLIQVLSMLKIYELKWNLGNRIIFKKIPASMTDLSQQYAYHEIKEIVCFASFYHVDIQPLIQPELFADALAVYLLEYKILFKKENIELIDKKLFSDANKSNCFHLPYCLNPASDYFFQKNTDEACLINQWPLNFVSEFYLHPRLEIYAQKLWNPLSLASYQDFLKLFETFYPVLWNFNLYFASDYCANPVDKQKLLDELKSNFKAEYDHSLYEKKARL